jgi:hypothetical protein
LIDAVVEIRRVAAQKELRHQPRIEGAVAPSSGVALASRNLGGRALALSHADGVLQRERLRRLGSKRQRDRECEEGETHKTLHELVVKERRTHRS